MVPEALRAAGIRVERKTDHFDQDTEDTIWVPEVGKRGWVILSADENLKHNHIEIVALLKSNTHSFLLTSGSFTGPEMAKAFVTAIPQMTGIISTLPAPVVCKVWKTGEVRVAYTHDDLIKRAIETKDRDDERNAKLSDRTRSILLD